MTSYLLTIITLVAVVQCTSTSVLSGFEDGVNDVRKTIHGMTDLADDGVSIGQRKVRNEYVPFLESVWRAPIKQAAAGTGASADAVAKCSTSDPIPGILDEVRDEASQCVAERVPPGVPAVHEEAKNLLKDCDQFVAEARVVAQQCDALNFFQGSMCLATQLAPMGGRVGLLGGRAGILGGSVAELIDGSAKNCTAKASGWQAGGSNTRDARAREAANTIAACVRGH